MKSSRHFIAAVSASVIGVDISSRAKQAAPLPALELRLTLLFERARAFACVFGLVDLLPDRKVDSERLLLGQALRRGHGFLDLLHGDRPVRGDLFRQLARDREG